MRVYVAGPMTGYPELNEPAFRKAQTYIESLGHEAVVPHDLHPVEDWNSNPQQIVLDDVKGLLSCQRIFMLRGWELSKGAKAEHAIAVWLDMSIWYQTQPTQEVTLT